MRDAEFITSFRDAFMTDDALEYEESLYRNS